MMAKSYVAKCVEHRHLIEAIIQNLRCPLTPDCPVARGLFEVGDLFHHPGRMEKGEVKEVKELAGLAGDIIYSDSNVYEYPAEKCVIIPTEDQLRAGLEASSEYYGPEAYGNGPERLLDEIIKARGLDREED